MMCPEMEVRLNEYVDGTLAPADRTALEAHLAGCAGCRAAVAELQGLVAAGRDLPRTIVPSRDLWAGIAARINERGRGRRWWRERAFWAGALAAAATLVVAIGIYRLTSAPPARTVTGEQGWAALQADYDRAADELSRLLAAQRGRLQPGTVTLVERNLRIIDAAIRESRAALARDPGNVDLRTLYAAAARQKVELLRWVARVAAAG
jgi:predicted anti-sigma-YlaC factor YlaD